ncbi:hypothetical protein ACFSJY_10045 [Thalassotalea euphylliae]|uniref:hypothetical protein n=1 Tax=Thalassotalea euphylliae TaxID=1655234 RepID=UPI0036302893
MAVNNKRAFGAIAAVVLTALAAVTVIPKALASEPDALSASVMDGLVSNSDSHGNGLMDLLPKDKRCDFESLYAENIMLLRQYGASLSDVYGELETRFAKSKSAHAWSMPIGASQDDKAKAVAAFKQLVHQECMNSKA